MPILSIRITFGPPCKRLLDGRFTVDASAAGWTEEHAKDVLVVVAYLVPRSVLWRPASYDVFSDQFFGQFILAFYVKGSRTPAELNNIFKGSKEDLQGSAMFSSKRNFVYV
uniref:Uncharacterized protein n=1 Tax=Steinernema glaseri TaxID=37863 RepID=A0A1I7ZSH2_9BILA